jgi:5-methylcytosine-specific restriction endonuclease McrA
MAHARRTLLVCEQISKYIYAFLVSVVLIAKRSTTMNECETLKKYRERNDFRKEYYALYRKEKKQAIREYCIKHRMTRRFQYLSKAANKRYKSPTITALDLWKIAKKQKLICALTGVRLTSENISVDHILPKSLGGENVFSNIRLVTKSANSAKQAMTDKEFIAMCRRIVTISDLNNGSLPYP